MGKKGMEKMTSPTSKTFTSKRQRTEQDRAQVEEKWIGPGGVRLAHPRDCAKVDPSVVAALKEVCVGKVCEIGCGTGRIAKLFSSENYIGLDINHLAVGSAEKACPRHNFDLIMWDTLYPTADTYLFFTVMMHIPDAELSGVIKRLDRRVVVVESMGRWLRDYGKGNNYQRDPKEYRNYFWWGIGMGEKKIIHCKTEHYPYYLDVMVFE